MDKLHTEVEIPQSSEISHFDHQIIMNCICDIEKAIESVGPQAKIALSKTLKELSSLVHAEDDSKSSGNHRVISERFSFVRQLSQNTKDGQVNDWIAAQYLGQQYQFGSMQSKKKLQRIQNTVVRAKKAFMSNKPSNLTAKKREKLKAVSNLVEEVCVQLRVTKVMATLGIWDFNVFELNAVTLGKPLVVMMKYIYNKLRWKDKFDMPLMNLVQYMTEIESHYTDTEYHNSTHAADVVASVYYWCQSEKFQNLVGDFGIMLALIVAAVHDVGHPGFTNSFIISVENDLALIYNDKSVLENYHCSLALNLLREPENDIFCGLSKIQRKATRELMIEMILGTDMSFHMEHLAELNGLGTKVAQMYNNEATKSTSSPQLEGKHLRICLMAAIHTADVANPTKAKDLSLQWTQRFLDESYSQGDFETLIGLPVTPCYDREIPLVKRTQLGFIKWVVEPQFLAWSEILPYESQVCMQHLSENKEFWENNATEFETTLINKSTMRSQTLRTLPQFSALYQLLKSTQLQNEESEEST